MSAKITGDVLEARLRCKYKAHLQAAGQRGEPHDYEVLLREAREQADGIHIVKELPSSSTRLS